ncbi:MAG: phosphoribosylglycinamide formyltransferase [Rhodospirillaceae bacterium]|nr:phosphoribosylglycinamide formyltransferase [Rhodospirillaceae bacterium]
MARLKVGVLISGSGTNLQALIDDCARADAESEIVLVLSNRADAFGLTRAERAGLPHRVIDHRGYASRASFERALSQALESSGVELVCLAGFMRVLTAEFVERWRDRLINIHPSLLPAFKGLDTHARAIETGVRFAGCTVHFVRPEVDKGPIIVQAAVPVLPDDMAETLAARVLHEEHRCLPLAVRLIAQGRVSVAGERCVIDAEAASGALINPAPGSFEKGPEPTGSGPSQTVGGRR